MRDQFRVLNTLNILGRFQIKKSGIKFFSNILVNVVFPHCLNHRRDTTEPCLALFQVQLYVKTFESYVMIYH